MSGDLAGENQGRFIGTRGRRYAVDQAEAQGLVGTGRARAEEQVLGSGEAAEGDQARRPHRHAQGRSREAHAQVGAPDPHVAGDCDLGAAADHVAVADRDRRLWEGDDLVVDVGEELHAADLAFIVELLLDVGASREAHVVGGAEEEHPHRFIAARHHQMLEQLDQHLGVDRVARLRPLQVQHRHAPLVDLVARHRRLVTHRNLHTFTRKSTRIRTPGDHRVDLRVHRAIYSSSCAIRVSVSSAACAIRDATSSWGSRKRPSTYDATISGSVESGRPTPTRTRQNSGSPKPRLRLLRPLWPARPTPSRTLTSPNGRSIPSCSTMTRSNGTLSEPRAGPAESPETFIWVCGSRIATRAPPGPVRPSLSRPPNFDFALGKSQRRESSAATSKPMLCRVAT